MSSPDPGELNEIRSSRIFVAGHSGMVGSAIVRRLEAAGCHRLILRSHEELDLTDQAAVERLFADEKPEYVFLAAARVGGIRANDRYPAQFIRENLLIETHVIEAAHQHQVRRLLFLGSSCIYPRLADQPITEDALLTGPLEPTNEPYAIAKIAGIKLCESFNRQYGTDFRSAMPTNLYGPNDNFHPEDSHVLPALMRRIHLAHQTGAAEVEIWGTGKPRREFLHVDDLADACLFLMCLPPKIHSAHIRPMRSHVNVGTGHDVTIRELAEMISTTVGFDGALRFNTEYPDGTPRKLLDVSILATLGWSAATNLRSGLESTYRWFVDHERTLRS